MIISFLDFPKAWQFGFQDPATAIMEGIIELHNSIFFFLIVITIIVFYMFYKILVYFSFQFHTISDKYFTDSSDRQNEKNCELELETESSLEWKSFLFFLTKKNILSQNINHNSNLEIIWVILPAIVLIFIAIPSFTILYSMDEIFDPNIVIKIIGHQWYWSYEYSNNIFDKYIKYKNQHYTYYFPEWKFDSLFDNDCSAFWNKKRIDLFNSDFYLPAVDDDVTMETMLNKFHMIWEDWEDIVLGNLYWRLLDTDVPMYLPTQTHIQLLVTSEDVLHSWAVPSLGIKIDCVPGRLNQVSLFIKRPGFFFGQCSEICGINHGFMPIKIIAISKWAYLKYTFNFFLNKTNV